MNKTEEKSTSMCGDPKQNLNCNNESNYMNRITALKGVGQKITNLNNLENII